MKKLFIGLGLVVLILNCTNNKPLPNGYDLLERDNKTGLMPPVTLRPVKLASYWKTPATGGYSTLLLGNKHNASSSVLFKCRNLIKIDTTKTLVSSTLKLYGTHLFGSDSLLSVAMHRVNAEWTENSVKQSDIDGNFDVDPVEQLEFTFRKNNYASLPFSNLEFIREWIVDSYQSEQTIQGLLLVSESPEIAAEFVSVDASDNQAYIEVVTQDTEGVNDTTKAFLSHDASLLRFESDIAEETLDDSPSALRVGNVSGYSSLIKFDISSIPSSATIHKALLTLYVDNNNSLTKSDEGMSLSVARLISDSLWAPADVQLDSLTLPAFDIASGGSETFAFDGITPVQNVSQIVQKWISLNDATNNGFLLSAQYPGKDFQEIEFKTGASDSVFAPTLVITYAMPPSHRFAD